MRSKTTPTLVNAIGSLLIIACLMQMTACNPKQAMYFQGGFDTSKYITLTPKEAIIQKNDILNIMVYSDDLTASADYNQVSTGDAAVSGYLVNEEGYIQFPHIGKLHVEGLTKAGLTKLLDDNLKDKLKNPNYVIRFLNYKITVQGEVNRGGEFSIPNERVTILEAIALAGDFTIYARKKEVLLIRELNGTREIKQLDITDPTIFASPYYYLKQNDLVIVQPTKRKPSAERQEVIQNISLAATLISIAGIIYSITK